MTAPTPDRPRPYFDAAQLYRDADWVAPIPVRGKYPPPLGWTGVGGMWPSGGDVESWKEDRGHDNIALRLPPDILGVDIDAYGDKRGETTLAECEAAWGPLPETWRSTSRNDGISGIRLFRIPEGKAWPGQLPGGGVELVRWDHRYCMCWPSIHPDPGGRVYRWTKDGVTALNIPRPHELPLLPQAWVDGLVRGSYLHEAKARLGAGAAAAWLTDLDGADQTPCLFLKRIGQRLAALLRDPSTSRHEAALTGVLDLVRRAEEGHHGILTVLSGVGETFVGQISADGSRSDTAAWGEWARLLEGAVAIIVGGERTPTLGDPCIIPSDPPWHPGDPIPTPRHFDGTPQPHREPTPPPAVAPELPPATIAEDDIVWDDAKPPRGSDPVGERLSWLRADKEARARLLAEDAPLDDLPTAVSLTEFLATPDEAVTERIGGLLPIGARVVLAAQMKAGKTTLVGNLIHSLADGDPFLGAFTVTPPTGNIVLLDNEMDARTLRRWLREMNITNTDAVRLVSMIGRIGGFDIRIPRIFDYWVKTLAELETTVLIVDCLKPILDTLDLDERSETGKITTPLTRLKTEAGISELILVHHMGHSGERSRGDSALRGWPEAEWQLVRLTEVDEEPDMDAPRFLKAYGRDVNMPEAQLQFDASTRRLSVQSGSRKEGKEKAKAVRLEGLLLDIVRVEPGINSTAIAMALRAHKGWGQKGDETKILAGLVLRSVLRLELGSRGSKHYSLGQNAPGSPDSPDSPNSRLEPPPNPYVWGGYMEGGQSPNNSPQLDFGGSVADE